MLLYFFNVIDTVKPPLSLSPLPSENGTIARPLTGIHGGPKPARLRSRRRRTADAPAVGPWGVNIHIPSEDDGVGRLSAPECF